MYHKSDLDLLQYSLQWCNDQVYIRTIIYFYKGRIPVRVLFEITVLRTLTVPFPSSVHFIAAPSVPLLPSIIQSTISSEPVPSKPYSLFLIIQFDIFPPPPEIQDFHFEW